MNGAQRQPALIYLACVLLAIAFWVVFFRSRMDGVATILFVLFLPLTGTPYVVWVVHREGKEPQKYFDDAYAGHSGLMWVVRIFMMLVVSLLSSVVAIAVLAGFTLVTRLFK